MKLIIGNKNYSSWSMRPWVLLKQFDIKFEEVKLRLDFSQNSNFYEYLKPLSPVSKVPILVDENKFAVWDSLAIIEFIADKFPSLNIWPKDSLDRARARSLCSEMHSGFQSLRGLCPMNIDADLNSIGAELLEREPALIRDLSRFDQIASERKHGGPFLFGDFSSVDAFYAPMVMRVTRYGLPVSDECKKYIDAIIHSKSVIQWVNDAKEEKDFLDFEEPYRKSANDFPTIQN